MLHNRFSVLISTYHKDNPKCLKEALESVFNQSLIPNQVVLVIDGNILLENENVIRKFEKDFEDIFTVVKLKDNVGLGNSLNEGLKKCKYNLIARMDADDECFYNRFETQIQYFENNNNLSVLGSYVEEFHSTPKDYGKTKKVPLGYSNLKKYSNFRNPLNHPSVMFKKDIIENVGGYIEINLFEDYYLWLRILKAGYTIDNIPECLVYSKVGNDLIGRRHGLSYLKKEFYFLKRCKQEKLISLKSFYIQILTRLPLRLLPKNLLLIIYKSILRH